MTSRLRYVSLSFDSPLSVAPDYIRAPFSHLSGSTRDILTQALYGLKNRYTS